MSKKAVMRHFVEWFFEKNIIQRGLIYTVYIYIYVFVIKKTMMDQL